MPDGSTLPGWPRALGADLAAAYVGVSASAWHKAVNAGAAPAAVRLTICRRMVWLREDLDQWLNQQAGRPPTLPAGQAGQSTSTNPWDDI